MNSNSNLSRLKVEDKVRDVVSLLLVEGACLEVIRGKDSGGLYF